MRLLHQSESDRPRQPEASESGPRLAVAEPAWGALEASFVELYEDHFDFVWRSLRRLGVDTPDCDDAVQDVFVVAYRRLADFEGRSSLRTWLFGISARVAKDHRRRQRRKGGLLQLSSRFPSPASDPHTQSEDAELLEFIERFLASLDETQRAVFILADLEQMSAEEIAEATGAKLNTVYSRLRLARKRFRKAVLHFQAEEP
jgi:RNA polymerase sigma-70 factor (ECF subfamily)